MPVGYRTGARNLPSVLLLPCVLCRNKSIGQGTGGDQRNFKYFWLALDERLLGFFSSPSYTAVEESIVVLLLSFPVDSFASNTCGCSKVTQRLTRYVTVERRLSTNRARGYESRQMSVGGWRSRSFSPHNLEEAIRGHAQCYRGAA